MNNNQRKIEVSRVGERRPFKPKKWSHQQELEKLKGQKVGITFVGGVGAGGFATGVLREADQFTISVEHYDKSMLIYFKHDIRSIGAI